MKTEKNILILEAQKDYELLDSGEGEKLERFGEFILARPDPQALWLKSNSSLWENTHGYFKRSDSKTGNWIFKGEVPQSWVINIENLKMVIKPTSFKHVGIFPEQVSNWEWLRGILKKVIAKENREIKVLNLFGYTGGATIACSLSGAKVTHVDSSKSAITWANLNAKESGLKEDSIRWILEDAFSFVEKEVKRGKTYDGIIMDPPSFGHGSEGEIWKIEKQFTDLIDACFKLLSPDPLFFLMSGYASGYSSVTYANNLFPLNEKYKGIIEHGELAIEEKEGKRLLPAGIYARWKKLE